MMKLPERIKIVEVGPRDGLQNETRFAPTKDKAAFIERLVDAGLSDIEVTSFVHPNAVPQLADADQLASMLPDAPGVTFSALVPNARGLERAIAAGIKRIAVFTAASESFAQKNVNMSVDESLAVFRSVTADALSAAMTVRGYVSTCFVCPYEGEISSDAVLKVCNALLEMGVDEVTVSDTIGAASPKDVDDTLSHLLREIPPQKIALHFHDTYGTALANVYAGVQLGITTFDASAGGLGGCPFAPSAAGNLATEDLVYMLERMGADTGVDVTKLTETAVWMGRILETPLPSRQARRLFGTSIDE